MSTISLPRGKTCREACVIKVSKMKIVLLGAPGSGKGTQASLICHKYGLPHISTGDIFRHNMAEHTSLGRLAAEFIGRGELVPDKVTVDLVRNRISEEDCRKGFVLDGFPRTVSQAEELRKFADIDVVLDIDIKEEKLLARLTGRRSCKTCGAPFHISSLGGSTVCPDCGGELVQRDDDREETVASRLSVYREKTFPLIEFYKKENILKQINGDGSVEDVFERIREILDNL